MGKSVQKGGNTYGKGGDKKGFFEGRRNLPAGRGLTQILIALTAVILFCRKIPSMALQGPRPFLLIIFLSAHIVLD